MTTMTTPVRCHQILTKCGKSYNNCSLFKFDNTNGKCNFSMGSNLRKKSHYDVLGITPKSTQADVKAAYYDLSKTYHPDRNDGCSEASQKFRDITAAYEILGNYKLRRLYDKGVVHTAGAQYADVMEEKVEVPDDDQTRFYKRHMQRTATPTVTGRTPIFNFDEWNAQHYGKAFQRNQAARRKYSEKSVKENIEANSIRYEITILGGMFLLTVLLYFVGQFDMRSPDDISNTPTKNK